VIWLRRQAKLAVLRAVHRRYEAERRALDQPGGALHPRNWDLHTNAQGHLAFSGVDAVELAHTYGTPLHVIQRTRLSADFARFRDAFKQHWDDVAIGYSYKTNPLPGVLAVLHSLGAWAEVISEFELWLALKLDVNPERIIYNGPAKSISGLRLALSRGIRIINVDNAEEIEDIDRLRECVREPRKQNVGVRVVTSVGWSGQFGHKIASGEARAAFVRLSRMEHVAASGVHVHLGTGLRDVSTYLQAVREVLDFARELKRELGISISHFDFGGGFGVPTVRPYTEWDDRLMANGYPPRALDPAATPPIDAFAKGMSVLMRDYHGEAGTAGAPPMLILEPGRAITSQAQALLLRVLAVKEGDDKTFKVILDGGKNIALPTGYEMHELLPASSMHAEYDAVHSFFGPLCHPGDVLVRAKSFPRVHPLDVVALMDAGAYFIPNQMNFSNPRPAAVMVDTGEHWLVRTRESFEDVVRLDDAASSRRLLASRA
jgi:diaminopimelate decarboxylase